MKKIFLALTIIFSSFQELSACADGGDESSYFYNLFNQTLSKSPQYTPFLMTYDSPYYSMEGVELKDEKIEDWANYLNITYDQAYHLVYKASKQAIDQLTKSGKSSDQKLNFANGEFSKKHKQALLYLSYAKYLEPYMSHNYLDTGEYWGYVERSDKNATQLDYFKVMNVLERSWKAETDAELKLRYGYQMVRFAHYSNQYNEALKLFKQYVQPLNTKSVMYYYALDQKAGAERAVGNLVQAYYDFFEVFSHTNNRKESAYNSMKVTQEMNFEKLLSRAKTNQEKMDLYLLIGFNDFSNPLAPMKQILKLEPNAEQARILYARAINLIERNYLQSFINGSPWTDEQNKPVKYPALEVNNENLSLNFVKEVIAIGKEQAAKANDADFWNLSIAYLAALQRDFSTSKNYLAKVNGKDSQYLLHKKMIEMLVDLNQQEKITPAYEQTILAKYGDLLNFQLIYPKEYTYGEKIFTDEELLKDRLRELTKDILANRYFLQGDKAKAFLIHNSIYDFAANPNWDLLIALENFDQKKNKNDFENYLVQLVNYQEYDEKSYEYRWKKSNYKLADFIANYKGTYYLKEGNFELAKAEFKKIPSSFKIETTSYYSDEYPTTYNWYGGISNGIFGYNRIECFNCSELQVMDKSYVNDFNFIPKEMNKLQLTDVLIQLTNLAKGKDEKASKANYLLANFYYNTTSLGYYRELLSLDRNNSNGPKFHDFIEKKDENLLNQKVFVNYYKGYNYYSQYINNFDSSLNYAKAALTQTANPELKAHILFTAAKAEQGKFYTYARNYWSDSKWYADYDDEKLIAYKVKNYRKYFKELKSLANTKAYKTIKSNCKYFDTYVNL